MVTNEDSMKKNLHLNSSYQGFDTYTKHDHHAYVKESFKVAGDLIEKKILAGDISINASVLDIGCATGAFIGYLDSRFPGFSFEGLDISKDLLDIAKMKLPNINFTIGGIKDISSLKMKNFDIVLCFGVLGIFDEVEAKDAVYKLIELAKPGGLVYIFSQFNEYDIDVMIKHKRVGKGDNWSEWGSGWNIYSYSSISSWLDGRVKSHKFIDFSLSERLVRGDNPVRTWSIEMADGSQKLTNGLKLMVDLRFLEINV